LNGSPDYIESALGVRAEAQTHKGGKGGQMTQRPMQREGKKMLSYQLSRNRERVDAIRAILTMEDEDIERKEVRKESYI
jgi:hypothetical protein